MVYRFERPLNDEDLGRESRLDCNKAMGEVSPLFAGRGKGVTRCVLLRPFSSPLACYQCDCSCHGHGADHNALQCALSGLLEIEKSVQWPGQV